MGVRASVRNSPNHRETGGHSYFHSLNSALEVGSVKVNTINLARIAYASSNADEYLTQLAALSLLACKTLDCIRDIIKEDIEAGMLPNYSQGVINLKSQYSTIGIIGVFEAVEHMGKLANNGPYIIRDELGNYTYTDAGIQFAKDILACITEVKNGFMADKDYSINIEQIPAERAASVLMEKDGLFYPDMIPDRPMYGNQWVPLSVPTTITHKIKLSAELDKACSGGSIAHINLDAPIDNFDVAWSLLNAIADSGVTYFAFCTRISACANNHGFYGEVCPTCGGEKVTTYQRIVGFLVPETNYSKERKKEFRMREWYTQDKMEEICESEEG